MADLPLHFLSPSHDSDLRDGAGQTGPRAFYVALIDRGRSTSENPTWRAMRNRLAVFIIVCGLGSSAVAFAWPRQVSSRVAHYEYVAGVGGLYVYNIDNRSSLVGRFSFPGVDEVRGIGATAATGMLYVSYGGFPTGLGHLLEFSLYRRKVVYDRSYPFGIDSFDISHDGQFIFMPTGENTSGDNWHVLAATTGRVLGAIAAGRAPHDTVVGASGQHVFLGGAADRYLYEAGAERPWRIVGRMGPLEPGGLAGVRPFTVNARDTLAFTTGNRFLGFQVSDTATGRVLYTVSTPGFSIPPAFQSVASHGIGLSPDQRHLWLVDKPNRAIHEFDVSGLPRRAPVLIATVHVSSRQIGWLNLSRDGRYVFVGDAGNVIDARARKTVATIPALAASRYNIEVDWSGRKVCAAYPRESLGYLDVAPPCSARTH